MPASKPALLSAVPQFTVPDVVVAWKYWCDVLGFELKGTFGEPPMFAMVRRGPVEVFFNAPGRFAVPERPSDRMAYDAYLRVDGLEALAEELRRRDAKIVEGPLTRIYGMREMVVEDCHGLRIAFGEEPAG